MSKHPPISEVLDFLRVDPIEGKLFWKAPSKFHKGLIGKEAGQVLRCERKNRPCAYWVVQVNNCLYRRSHIVFASVFGRWPTQIDHINRDSLEDSIYNLREATTAQNSRNQRPHTKASPLPPGVRSLNGKTFQARIALNGKTFYRTFKTAEGASEFYVSMRKALFGEFCGECSL